VTYKEFLAKLRKTPRKWLLEELPTDNMAIRFRDGACPIQHLSGLTLYDNALVGAIELGLSRNIEKRIIAAADGWHGNEKTRRDLLKACGLKKKP
jgi:hypothetical protein